MGGTRKPKDCIFCAKVFHSGQTLEQHMNKHTKERPYQCSKCDANFAFPNSLYTHENNIHLGIRHSCTVCRKSFTYLSTLVTHKRTHRLEKLSTSKLCHQTRKKFEKIISDKIELKREKERRCDKSKAKLPTQPRSQLGNPKKKLGDERKRREYPPSFEIARVPVLRPRRAKLPAGVSVSDNSSQKGEECCQPTNSPSIVCNFTSCGDFGKVLGSVSQSKVDEDSVATGSSNNPEGDKLSTNVTHEMVNDCSSNEESEVVLKGSLNDTATIVVSSDQSNNVCRTNDATNFSEVERGVQLQDVYEESILEPLKESRDANNFRKTGHHEASSDDTDCCLRKETHSSKNICLVVSKEFQEDKHWHPKVHFPPTMTAGMEQSKNKQKNETMSVPCYANNLMLIDCASETDNQGEQIAMKEPVAHSEVRVQQSQISEIEAEKPIAVSSSSCDNSFPELVYLPMDDPRVLQNVQINQVFETNCRIYGLPRHPPNLFFSTSGQFVPVPSLQMLRNLASRTNPSESESSGEDDETERSFAEESDEEKEAVTPQPAGLRVQRHRRLKVLKYSGKARRNGKGFLPGRKKRKHVCSHCGSSFQYPSGLKIHLTTHLPKDELPFVCTICSKRFTRKAYLNNHLASMHGSS